MNKTNCFPLRLPLLLAFAVACCAPSFRTVLATEAPSAIQTPKQAPLPKPTAGHLPLWRGFNLLEHFMSRHAKPFQEEDFAMIAELGFNFVRLPLDYRIWIVDGDWNRIDEAKLREVDKAVEYGRKYGIHVCINFHRAPGYCVNNDPPEPADLWTDETAQRVCAMHWAAFAKRYKGIGNEYVSFNLFNEPKKMDEGVYAAVVRKMIAAIRAEDPERLIIVDGLEYGGVPVAALADAGVAQATRGYYPDKLSHYKASWVNGSDKWPVPTWPMLKVPQIFHGPKKEKLHSPMVIEGDFLTPTQLRMRVGTVSHLATLQVKADGENVFTHRLEPGPGDGEWKEAIWSDKWQIWQNRYDRDYVASIPAGAKRVEIENSEGDWMTVTEIGLQPEPGKGEDLLELPMGEFEQRQGTVRWSHGTAKPFDADHHFDRDALWKSQVERWVAFEKNSKVGVFVGEWGSFNKTSHPVVLAWMEDCLKNWKQAGWGWALWNFRGSFGVLDSDRTDVKYENFHGHKLDREMLELLQKY